MKNEAQIMRELKLIQRQRGRREMETGEMNYTYIVKCSDGTLYCGWTNRLPERIAAHNSGKGAKYTKGRRPVTLVYSEAFGTKEEAMRREAEIKRLTRAGKLALISGMPLAVADTVAEKGAEGDHGRYSAYCISHSI